MFKESTVLFFFTESGLHLGSGDSLGGIDLAIQRERYTGFPMGAAAGLKGSTRAWFEKKYPESRHPEDAKKVLASFGPDTKSASLYGGALTFTDIRTLLFPVRSMQGVFSWITCQTVLERFKRDLAITRGSVEWRAPRPGECIVLGGVPSGQHSCVASGHVLLEDYNFEYQYSDAVNEIAAWLQQHAFPDLPEYNFWKERVASNLLVVRDDVFADFTKLATEVEAHVKLESGTKTAVQGGLFYQENVPCDTVLYAVTLANDDRRPQPADGEKRYTAAEIDALVKELGNERIQMGGSESTGKGIVCVQALNLA